MQIKKHHKNVQDQKNDTDEENNENVPSLAFMMDRRCYCCGKVVNKSPQCRYKDGPNSEWVINKEKEKDQYQAHVRQDAASQSDETASAPAYTTSSENI